MIRKLLLFLTAVTTSACRCVPVDFRSSVKSHDAAARVEIYEEMKRPKNRHSPRYFRAKVTAVYKGCEVSKGQEILVRTQVSSASCGVSIRTQSSYLLVGDVSHETNPNDLRYSGKVFSVNTCSATKKWRGVRRKDKRYLYSRQQGCDDPPEADLDCKQCPHGYNDGCNRCMCEDGLASCTEKACSRYGTPFCLKAPVLCTQEVKTCPGGTAVGRDPKKGCAFKPCPKLNCDRCPGGYHDGCNRCKCDRYGRSRCTYRFCRRQRRSPYCHEKKRVTCDRDTKRCPDGSFVSRDPDRGCEFRLCSLDCETCPGGFFDGCNSCGCDPDRPGQFPICTLRACQIDEFGEQTCNKCKSDHRECRDGTRVFRDPDNRCRFKPCPRVSHENLDCEKCPHGFFDGCNNCHCSRNGRAACTKRACPGFLEKPYCFCRSTKRYCADGSYVKRNPKKNCRYDSCPRPLCCPAHKKPDTGACFEGIACCPDGEWSCSIGDGKTFPCGDKLITSGFGKEC